MIERTLIVLVTAFLAPPLLLGSVVLAQRAFVALGAREPQPRLATWYWRLWWWYGYRGLFQLHWWWLSRRREVECRAKSWQPEGHAICRLPRGHEGRHTWEVQ